MDEQTELDLLRQAEDEWIDYLHAFDQVNPAQALNMADMSFLYPNMSSDTTVALALQNVLATSQTASQLARLENREQNRSLLQNIGHGLKAGVRTLALGVDGIWEEGFSRPFRTSVLFMEGLRDDGITGGWGISGLQQLASRPQVFIENINELPDAYAEAGGSNLVAVLDEIRHGRPVNIGTGFVPGYDPQAEGRPIVPELQAHKQSLQFRGVNNITFGRVLAHELASSNDTAFNLASGALDVAAAIKADPTRIISLGNQANRALRGVGSGGTRNWVINNRVDRWLTSGEGREFIDWAVRTDSPTEFMRALRSNDLSLIDNLVQADNATDAHRIFSDAVNAGVINRKPGSAASAATNILTFGHGRSLSALAARSPRGLGGRIHQALDDTRLGQYMTNMPGSRITVHNIDQAGFSLNEWMRGANMPKEYRDEILTRLSRLPEGNRTGILEITDDIMRRFADDLGDADPQVAEWANKSINLLNDGLKDTSAYWVDGMAQNPHQFNPIARMNEATGTPTPSPHDFVEMLARDIILPDARDVRRAFSRTRRLSNKLRSGAPGFRPLGPDEAAVLTRAFDAYMTTWKTFQLLRGAWTTRVIGEEQVRMGAAGLTSMFNHPGDYIADVIFRRRRNLDAFGGSFADADEYRRAVPQEFIGSWFSNRRATHISQQGYTYSTFNRATGEMGAHHVDGWTNEVIRLADSPLNRALVTDNFDDVLDEFMDGRFNVIRGKLMDTENAALLQSREGSRLYLESLQARLHSKLGGWRNGVQPFHVEFTDSTGVVRTVDADEAHKLLHSPGTTPDQFHYVIDVHGEPDLLDAIATRTLAGTTMEATRVKARQYSQLKQTLATDYKYAIPARVKVAIDPIVEHGGDKMRDRFVETMFSMLMGRPTSRLSRSPVFRQSYWNRGIDLAGVATPEMQQRILKAARKAKLNSSEIRRLQDTIRRSSGELDSLKDFDRIAKAAALNDTQNLLYDLSRRNQFFDIHRNIFPFADAWWEVSSTWVKLLYDKPQHLNKVNRTVTNLRNEGWFQPDPETGQEMFFIPADPILGALGLNKEDDNSQVRFGAFTSSASIVGDLFPGVGPTLQLPYSMMREADKSIGSEFLDMITPLVSQETLDEIITPYGITQGENILEKLANANLPTWMRRTITHFSDPDDSHTFARERARLIIDMYQNEMMSGRYNLEDANDRQRAMEAAYEKSASVSIIKTMSAFIGPVNWHPRYEVRGGQVVTKENPVDESAEAEWIPVRLIADYWRVLQEQYGYDDAKTVEAIQALMGTDEAWSLGYIASLSGNQRIRQYHATSEGLDWARDNPHLFDRYRNTAYYMNPEGSAYRAENFDFNAWRAALERGDIEPLTPSEYAGKLEQGIASLVFDLTLNQMLEEGYDPESAEGKKFLSVLRSDLRELFPSYSNEIASLPADVDPAVQIAETYRWLDDPEVMATDIGQAVGQYLDLRDQAIAKMRDSRNIDTTNFTDFLSKEKQPYAEWLKANAKILMQMYPDFIYIWNDVYRRELYEAERVEAP